MSEQVGHCVAKQGRRLKSRKFLFVNRPSPPNRTWKSASEMQIKSLDGLCWRNELNQSADIESRITESRTGIELEWWVEIGGECKLPSFFLSFLTILPFPFLVIHCPIFYWCLFSGNTQNWRRNVCHNLTQYLLSICISLFSCIIIDFM